MTGVVDKISSRRQQVQRILASQEFASLRHVREFLSYVSEAAFEGRSSLDQVEIADRVLHRGKDFNPLDDASVRKYATILRQKLKHYYEAEGTADPIVVTLPVRSYVPHFEVRGEFAEVEKDLESAQPGLRSSTRRLLPAAAILTGVVTLAWVIFWIRSPRSEPSSPVFVLNTVPGDIMHGTNDLPGNAIRLGPLLNDVDDWTVRMRFTPDRATQQAGIFVFSDPDQYVKLGRQFLSRSQLEFGLEYQGRYHKPPNTFTFDPDGQTGEPIWLSVRREYAKNNAFISNDGVRWRPYGNVLQMPGPTVPARAAIFADNGRSNAPSAPAVFDQLSVGPGFHNRTPGPANLSQFAGWRVDSTSAAALSAWSFDSEALAFAFTSGSGGYNCFFNRPLPKRDWAISTRLDFLSQNGGTAGLLLRGSKGEFRLIRWDLDGGSVTAEFTGHQQVNRKDFEGSPPLILRLECQNSILRGAFSRDNLHYEPLLLEVPLKTLGEDPRVGLYVSQSSWLPPQTNSPARFFYIHQEVSELSNYR